MWLWKYQLISNLVIITILLINWFLKKVVFVPNIAWSFVLWFRVSVKGNMNREVDTYTNLIPYTCGTSSHMSTHSWWRQTYWEWLSNGILPGSQVGKWWSCLILFTVLLCVKVEHSFSKETDCTLSNKKQLTLHCQTRSSHFQDSYVITIMVING